MSGLETELCPDATPEAAFDALREVAPRLAGVPIGTYPDGLGLETRARSAVDADLTFEASTETTAYVITWDRYSIYRQGYVTTGAVLLDVEQGALDPDGSYCQWLMVARLPHDEEELQALMLLAERGNVPWSPSADVPEATRTREAR